MSSSTSVQQKKVVVSIKHMKTQTNYELKRGLGLQALALRNKTPLEFDCRKSDCGICIVKVLSGAEQISAVKSDESGFLAAMRADKDERLACQCRILGDVSIEIEY